MSGHAEHVNQPGYSAARSSPSWKVQRLLTRLALVFADPPCPFALTLPNGQGLVFGAGAPRFRLVLKDLRDLPTLASLDEGRIAEAYMARRFDIEGDVLAMMDLRSSLSDRHYPSRVWRFLQAFVFGQTRTNARVIKAHYDLDPEFYLSFLGKARCYSQGIFTSTTEPVEIAMRRKFDYCLSASRIEAGSHILEVGPEWGGFTEYAARRGIRVTTITNSPASCEYMNALGSALGLHWDVILGDFLNFDPPQERFDAIVLMGIMGHLPDYPRVMEKFAELLKPGGRVYLDASAQRVKYEVSSFVYRYLYRGNHSPLDLADFLAAVAKTAFQLRAVHNDRQSYFLTFRQWAQNLEASRERVIREFGEHNFRRFQIYLWASARCFLRDTMQCYRVVLEKPA